MLNAGISKAENRASKINNNYKILGVPALDTIIAAGTGAVVGAAANGAGQLIRNGGTDNLVLLI